MRNPESGLSFNTEEINKGEQERKYISFKKFIDGLKNTQESIKGMFTESAKDSKLDIFMENLTQGADLSNAAGERFRYLSEKLEMNNPKKLISTNKRVIIPKSTQKEYNKA